MTGKGRTVWRRRLLLAGLVPLLLALLFAVKVAVMLHGDDRGRSSYADGDFEASRSDFGRNLVANVLEPWVADYDHGTAQYRLGAFEGSAASLRDALDTVPPEHECRVRINLALAHERLGDELVADDREAAAEEWRRGTSILEDGDCLEQHDPTADDEPDDGEGSRDPAGDEGESTAPADPDVSAEPDDVDDRDATAGSDRESTVRDARAVADRLGDKAEEADRAPDADDPRADELDRRNDQGERERREQEQRRRDREDRQDRRDGDPPDRDDPPNYEW